MEERFNNDTYIWFSVIADTSYSWSKHPVIKEIKAILKEIPNKKNLLKVIYLIKTNYRADGWMDFLKQAKDVVAGKYDGRGYKKEFRRRYNTVSRLSGQCSATSELFALLDQALNYNCKECN